MNPETALLYQTVVGLYQGLLGRAPEIEGLEFWMDAISSGDLSFQDLIDSFAETPEFETVNPGLGTDVAPEELATIFYKNLLGRQPDDAGLEFWTDLLASGTLEPGSFTAAFLETPEADERLGEAIENYIEDAADGTIDDPANTDLDDDVVPDESGEPDGGGDEDDGGHHTPTPPPFVNSYDDLSDDATFEDTEEMHAGKGNPSNGFVLSVNEHEGIELGLDARYYKDGDEVELTNGVFEMSADRQDDIRFAYSVSGVDLDAHDYRLYIDTDGGPGQAPMEFELVEDATPETHDFNNFDSPYDWILTGSTAAIADDGGNADVSQNIQALQWYSGHSPAAGDEYDIRLAAYEKGTSNLLAESEITIRVGGHSEGVFEDFEGETNIISTDSNYGSHVVVDGEAILTESATGNTGSFTKFDGYRSDATPPDQVTARVDVYLDPTQMIGGEGFDYSVAANGQDGAHQRDFVFHVAGIGEDLMVGASNGSDWTNGNLHSFTDGTESAAITAEGWYTFEHRMYEGADGALAVGMTVYDSAGAQVFHETLSEDADVFATEYGGNRYGWFTQIENGDDGIQVDNWSLQAEYF